MKRTVIYSRVSTSHQETSNQVINIQQMFPHAEVVEEIASGAKVRPALDKLVAELSTGDVLVVSALDRLGRRTSEILLLVESLERRGIVLKSIRESIDFSTIAGKLVCSILISVTEMERRVLGERTKAALAAKKKMGIIGGRRPKFTAEQIRQVKTLRSEGVKLKEIAARTGVSVSRVFQLTKGEANVID
ncbi:MAG: recombinase family protein [Bdellovibrionota bacterium]